jgi:hypothetical protein
VKFLPANRVFRGVVVSNFHGTCGSEGVKGKYASECVTIVALPSDHRQREQNNVEYFRSSIQVLLNALIFHQRVSDC